MPNNFQKHWTYTTSWSMVKVMHELVLWAICVTMQKVQFVYMSCDEVTMIDNQSWISTHVYVVEGWKWFPILLTLQQVVEGSHVNNLTKVIVKSLLLYGVFSKSNLVLKLVCFGIDSVTMFQGSNTRVTMQLKEKHAPLLLGVHYVAHWFKFSCVDIVFIVLGCKNWGVVPSCLQLLCTKLEVASGNN